MPTPPSRPPLPSGCPSHCYNLPTTSIFADNLAIFFSSLPAAHGKTCRGTFHWLQHLRQDPWTPRAFALGVAKRLWILTGIVHNHLDIPGVGKTSAPTHPFYDMLPVLPKSRTTRPRLHMAKNWQRPACRPTAGREMLQFRSGFRIYLIMPHAHVYPWLVAESRPH